LATADGVEYVETFNSLDSLGCDLAGASRPYGSQDYDLKFHGEAFEAEYRRLTTFRHLQGYVAGGCAQAQ
jgi:hypothetical protein